MRKRIVRCKWCRGPHLTNLCPNPRMRQPVVRQFGTVVDGRYVPPEGVSVRVMEIPNTMHSDALHKTLMELDGRGIV